MFHFNKLHPDFKLNGICYSKQELLDYSRKISLSDDYQKGIGFFLTDWLSDSNTIQVHTSGSTGQPKTISLKKKQMVQSALATAVFFNIKPKNTALLCLPTEFIAGKMMLVRAIVLGLHLDCIDSAIASISMIDKEYDFCAMVPLQVEALSDKLNLIKKLIVGGAPISPQLKVKLQDVKTEVFATYGMTETCTHVAIKKLGEPYFKALSNITFSIDNRNCLCIDAAKITDTRIVTNDVVALQSKTQFQWLGRVDNVINSGGIKLHPEELETKLSKIIEPNFFLTGLPDSALGTKLVLVIESIDNASSLLQQIKDSGVFNNYEIPKEVYAIPKFVRTKNGKIQRIKTTAILQK